MKANGSEIVIKALKEQRVKWLFGIPGTHNIELYDALLDEEDLMPVLITDEQSSGFIADGMARASGEMAALNLVPGAGLTHALSGISECYLDQIPLLVLVCGIRKDIDKSFQLHDVDQCSIVRPVSKAVFSPRTHAELYSAITKACEIARQAPQGPAVVEVPVNLYIQKGEMTQEALSDPPVFQKPTLNKGAVKKAAELLEDSKQISLYLGLGARGLEKELVQLAEILNATVFTTISGKGVFPENHPRFCWNMMGRSAPKEMNKIERESDCLLAIGCRFGEVGTASYGIEMPKTLIHVDVDTKVFDKNYKATLAVQGEAQDFVDALIPLLKGERSSRSDLLKGVASAHEFIRTSQASGGDQEKVQPWALFHSLQNRCGSEAVYATDSGNGTFLAMEYLKLSHGHSFLAPVDYSCMGYSVPAAIGAKLGCPERPVIALAGDGAFLMTGLELLTAKAYEVGVMVFVLRDRELSQIAQFQKASLNRLSCTEISDYSLKGLAEGMGIEFIEMKNNSQIESAIEKAIEISKSKKPVIVEVNIDYSKPTYFSQGVIKTNFLRFGWKDRLRLITRVVTRKAGYLPNQKR